MMHECYVGIRYGYGDTSMVTLNELKSHIRDASEHLEALKKDVLFKDSLYGVRTWTLADYSDKRKSTDLTRFEYCPRCGKKIDWKTIKKGGERYENSL